MSTKKEIKDLYIDVEYDTLNFPLTSTEYANLEKSILKDGIYVPIIINSKNIILDGHHRFKICKENSIDVIDTIVKNFDDSLEEKEFVIETNLNRRHYTMGQKAELGLKLLEIEKEKAKLRQQEAGKIYGE